MKIRRGDYDGASPMAYFDLDLDSLNRSEALDLLRCILHRADPGKDNADLVRKELEIAEQIYSEQR